MKTLLSWSSGKDSAWALHVLQQRDDIELVGLFCTINSEYERAAMHAVRVELIEQQAASAELPVQFIELPNQCTNTEYGAIMKDFLEQARAQGIECIGFGDLFLEDIRSYRESKLAGTGILPIFPIWGLETEALSRVYDQALLEQLPDTADPCGENGEFHSFAFAGPMFKKQINVRVGETVTRGGFVFADLLPETI
jgi:diphthamide synthase (EF-2-diphthine--ammonia ligase)